ncbi:hypothetical protein lbkm_0126 [Lachnospiraceae bacterium KM106-2]|nr:hypothetical protein lbkm_0126 [Lachnospiraceae bacterium KM106-2]
MWGEKMERKENRGSITIEASISLVFFIFAMVAILSVINICRVQSAIGNAMNLSAEEISQYCYLYQVCGIDTLDKGLAQNGEPAANAIGEGANSVDNILTNVENIYKLIGTEKSNLGNVTVDTLKSPTEAMEQYDNLKNAISDGEQSASEISSSVKSLWSQIKEIKKDPFAFVKSMVSLVASKGFTLAKSYIVGSLMGKKFVSLHLGDCTSESGDSYAKADAYLKQLGVVDGMDGLNFNLSNMMNNNSSDINLVVVYKVEVLPGIFSWKATLAQSASTRAWLDGDKN